MENNWKEIIRELIKSSKGNSPYQSLLLYGLLFTLIVVSACSIFGTANWLVIGLFAIVATLILSAVIHLFWSKAK